MLVLYSAKVQNKNELWLFLIKDSQKYAEEVNKYWLFLQYCEYYPIRM